MREAVAVLDAELAICGASVRAAEIQDGFHPHTLSAIREPPEGSICNRHLPFSPVARSDFDYIMKCGPCSLHRRRTYDYFFD